jgi:hypothetical protein
MTQIDINFAAVGRFIFGLPLVGVGLWFAFFKSRTMERLADGTVQSHFDHVALYIGVGVALFGMLFVSPDTVKEAVKYAKALLSRSPMRASQSTTKPEGD